MVPDSLKHICNPRELPSHAWGVYLPASYPWNRDALLNGPVQTQHIVFAEDLDGALPGDKLCQAWCVLEARVEIVASSAVYNIRDCPIVHVDKASVLEFLCDVPCSAFSLVRLLPINGRKRDETGDESFEASCKRSHAIDVYMMIRKHLHRKWGPLKVDTLESDQLHATVSLEISEMTTDDTDLCQFNDNASFALSSFYQESNDGMLRAHSTSSLNSQSEQDITDDTDQLSFDEEGVQEDIAHAYIAPESDIVVCTSAPESDILVCTSAPETATEPMNGLYTTPTVPMASGKEEMNASDAFTLEHKENVEMNAIEMLVWNSNAFTPEQKKEIWQARDMMVGPRSRVQEKPTPVAKSACRFLDLK